MSKKSINKNQILSNTPSVQKKIVQVKLKSSSEEVLIVAAGDFHVGAKSFNEPAFYKFIEQMLDETKKRQVYLILMGDLFDAINVNDKRFSLAEHEYTMDDSQVFLTTALKPLIDSKKVHFVGSLVGNHELKYCKGDINPIYQLYRTTGIEPLGIKAYIYFDFFVGGKKKSTLRTVAFHGASNSRVAQGRVKILRDFLKDNELTEDEFIRLNKVAFYGHTHDCRVETVTNIIPNIRTGIQARYTQKVCLTGSFYDTADFTKRSYAADRGFNPTPVGYIKATVSLNRDVEVEACLNNGLNPNVVDRTWVDM